MKLRRFRNYLIGLLGFLGLMSTSCRTSRYTWSTEKEYYRLPIYRQHVKHFKKMHYAPHTTSVFLGDSMTEGFDLKRHLHEDNLVNMGISGDFTSGLLRRIEYATRLQPVRIFVMIGINDITKDVSQDRIKTNYAQILAQLKTQAGNSSIYVFSLLPTSMTQSGISWNEEVNKRVRDLNAFLSEECRKLELHFVNLHPAFEGPDGNLNGKLTYDGLHLNDDGYKLWAEQIREIFE